MTDLDQETPTTTFDSTKESLEDLLKAIRAGKLQLPDFQRGWVWDDQHIKSLLASVTLSFPIGAIMLLESGNPQLRLQPQPIEGVELPKKTDPERFILDGQQRLTSLYQALMSGKPVRTWDARKKAVTRWYYLDITKALSPNGDREDAIVSVPEDRVERNFRNEPVADYSTTELECASEMLPLQVVFDVAELTNWQMKYVQTDPTRLVRWNQLVRSVIQRFQQYQVPLIVLRKGTPKVAVCQVFEKVNTGGVPLNVFELLTATYAIDGFNLRKDWDERSKRLRAEKVTTGVQNTDFLQAATLLTTRARRLAALQQNVKLEDAPGIACRRKEVLDLPRTDYQFWADRLTQGFTEAGRFLHAQRIFSARDLPYQTQLVPLAAAFAILGDRTSSDTVRSKLARWYWCGVFGELYGSAVETRFARDLPEILDWIEGGPEPSTVATANFVPGRLLTLRSRNSAAYKGLYALLIRDGCLEFRSGESIGIQIYFDDKIDIHHIFPKDWCQKTGVPLSRCDCVINKTAISARTNRMIGGNAPSAYLQRIEKRAEIQPTRMDEIAATHAIEPQHLRADDFEAFFAARGQALLDRIERATGKPMARDIAAMQPVEGMDEPTEEDEL